MGLRDANLPVMPGEVWMARRVAIDPTVAAIVLASNNHNDIVRWFQTFGAIGEVLTPVPRERAIQMIGAALERLLAGYAAS